MNKAARAKRELERFSVELKTKDISIHGLMYQINPAIEHYFGPESKEAAIVNSFKFIPDKPGRFIPGDRYLAEDKYVKPVISNEPELRERLSSCLIAFKKNIDIKGVYRPEKKNILADKTNWSLLGISAIIFSAGFGSKWLFTLVDRLIEHFLKR